MLTGSTEGLWIPHGQRRRGCIETTDLTSPSGNGPRRARCSVGVRFTSSTWFAPSVRIAKTSTARRIVTVAVKELTALPLRQIGEDVVDGKDLARAGGEQTWFG